MPSQLFHRFEGLSASLAGIERFFCQRINLIDHHHPMHLIFSVHKASRKRGGWGHHAPHPAESKKEKGHAVDSPQVKSCPAMLRGIHAEISAEAHVPDVIVASSAMA